MIIGYWGVRNLITLHNAPKVGLTPSAKFVTSTFQPGNIYLIPPDLESFRIAARVPVFIDFKSHPYRDIEIIEWFDRIKIANDFYAARAEVACNILRNIYGKYAITHVVLRNAFSITNCEILHELYKDSEFVVYRVVP